MLAAVSSHSWTRDGCFLSDAPTKTGSAHLADEDEWKTGRRSLIGSYLPTIRITHTPWTERTLLMDDDDDDYGPRERFTGMPSIHTSEKHTHRPGQQRTNEFNWMDTNGPALRNVSFILFGGAGQCSHGQVQRSERGTFHYSYQLFASLIHWIDTQNNNPSSVSRTTSSFRWRWWGRREEAAIAAAAAAGRETTRPDDDDDDLIEEVTGSTFPIQLLLGFYLSKHWKAGGMGQAQDSHIKYGLLLILLGWSYLYSPNITFMWTKNIEWAISKQFNLFSVLLLACNSLAVAEHTSIPALSTYSQYSCGGNQAKGHGSCPLE